VVGASTEKTSSVLVVGVYEGRESEQRAADSHVAHEDKQMDRAIEKTLGQTLNDMRHGNNAPIERASDGKAKNSWTFGL